tara:strand:+ start:17086 stop:17382 length:297 start_codon:yes stop_codon:yes gene_type:complete
VLYEKYNRRPKMPQLQSKTQRRVWRALEKLDAGSGQVSAPATEIARVAKCSIRTVQTGLAELRRRRVLHSSSPEGKPPLHILMYNGIWPDLEDVISGV